MFRSILMTVVFLFSFVLIPLDAQPTAPKRLALISVMSWYSPIGALNGARMWQTGGYRYQGNRSGENHKNYPDMPGLVLPETLAVGSEEFDKLMFDAVKKDLLDMKAAGFDVALYDMLPWPTYDPAAPLHVTNSPFTHFKTFLLWLKAGEAVGMKVALCPDVQNRSGDFPKGYKLNVDEWTRVLAGAYDLMKDYPALWRVEGKPAAVHFGTSIKAGNSPPAPGDPEPDGGWRKVLANLKAMGKTYYFVADIRPHDGRIEDWKNVSDAAYCFAPAGPKTFFVDVFPVMEKKIGIPFFWIASPGYYHPGLASYVEPDFDRIHRVYTTAIQRGVTHMAFLTWNDFGEDTDMAPSAYKGRCLVDIGAYYNTWFKTGVQPAIDREKIMISYPLAVPEKINAKPPVWGETKKNQELYQVDPGIVKERPLWGDWAGPAYQPKVFYWALVKSKKVLEIPGVGRMELAPGLSMGELGLIKPGEVKAKVDEKEIILPPIFTAAEEKSVGLHFRVINLAEPLPALTQEAVSFRPPVASVKEAFESSEWNKNFRLTGHGAFTIAENPLKDKVNTSAKCLRVFSPGNTPQGKISVELKPIPSGTFRFKIFSPLPNAGGPPYGQSVWSFRAGNAGVFSGDFLEYLNKARAGHGKQEPFGGYQAVEMGKLNGGWHEISGTWSAAGRLNVFMDGTQFIKEAPMVSALGSGVSAFTFSSAELGDGKRSTEVYLDDLVIEKVE